jgi:pimeloyl-ACP methyl ester carboxylesterase
MSRIDVSGTSLEVIRVGTGSPLLFLHPEHFWEQNQSFINQLADEWEVIAPHHPGFDPHVPLTRFRSVDDLAYLYLDLLDELKLTNVLVLGVSFGGWIALEMAVRNTARMRGLALIGPLGVKHGDRDARDYADLWALPEAQVRQSLFHHPQSVPDFAAMTDEQLTAHAIERQTVGHFAWKPYLHNPVLGRWLHRVDVPSLVMRGEFDTYVSAQNSNGISVGLAQCEQIVVGGAGHYPQLEAPTEVREALTKFGATTRVATSDNSPVEATT